MYFFKRGMVSGQVKLLYSSYSSLTRAVCVSRRWWDNGGDLSDLSGSIVTRSIINVHLWEKPRPLPLCFCITLLFSLCWTFSLLPVVLYLHALWTSPCCIHMHTQKKLIHCPRFIIMVSFMGLKKVTFFKPHSPVKNNNYLQISTDSDLYFGQLLAPIFVSPVIVSESFFIWLFSDTFLNMHLLQTYIPTHSQGLCTPSNTLKVWCPLSFQNTQTKEAPVSVVHLSEVLWVAHALLCCAWGQASFTVDSE